MNHISSYTGSAVLYLTIILISTGLAWLACHKKKYKKYLFLLVMMQITFLALRGENVGTDTAAYLRMSRWIENGLIDITYGEIGYKYFTLLLVKLFPIENISIIAMAVITIVLFILRMWEMRRYIDFSIATFIFTAYFYWTFFNYSRQGVAMALVFWATRFLTKGKVKIYFLILIIAILFHTSAFIAFVIYFVNVFFQNKGKIFFKDFVWLPIVLIVGVFFLSYSDRAGDLLERYFNIKNILEAGISSFFTIALVVIIEVFSYSKKNGNHQIKMIDSTLHEEIKIYQKEYFVGKIIYFIGLFLSVLLSNIEYAERVTLYLVTYEMVYYGYKNDTQLIRLIKKVVIVLLMGRSVFSLLYNGGYGIMPYAFYVY